MNLIFSMSFDIHVGTIYQFMSSQIRWFFVGIEVREPNLFRIERDRKGFEFLDGSLFMQRPRAALCSDCEPILSGLT